MPVLAAIGGALGTAAAAVGRVAIQAAIQAVKATVRAAVQAVRALLKDLVESLGRAVVRLGRALEDAQSALRHLQRSLPKLRIRITATKDVRGLQRFRAALAQAVDTALAETAEQLAADWRGGVPVRTGRYRDSIQVSREGQGLLVSTDTPYAIFSEYGTHRMPARPALRPALEKARRALPGRVRQHLAAELRGS